MVSRKDFIGGAPVRRSVARKATADTDPRLDGLVPAPKPATAPPAPARKPRAPRAPKMPDMAVTGLLGGLEAHAVRLGDMAKVARCVLGSTKLTDALKQEADSAAHLVKRLRSSIG